MKNEKTKTELIYGKNGELICATKEGIIIQGLSKADFTRKSTNSEQNKLAMQNFYRYKASISRLRMEKLKAEIDMYLKKAEDALKVKSEAEKLQEQIANSEKKIQELKLKLKAAGSK